MKIRQFRPFGWVAVAGVFALAWWLLGVPDRTNTVKTREPLPELPKVNLEEQPINTERSGSMPPRQPTEPAVVSTSFPLRQSSSLAISRSLGPSTNLQLVSSESLTLSETAIAAFELTGIQAYELNEAIQEFVERLRSEELAHAYVAVTSAGNEEIVVPAFDRAKTVDWLRAKVTNNLGSAISDFVIEQVGLDRTLAVGSSEIRVYIEQGKDGADREVFVRKVRRPGARDSKPPIQTGGIDTPSAVIMKTASLVRPEFNIRTRHLFSAIDTLPRRQESPNIALPGPEPRGK